MFGIFVDFIKRIFSGEGTTQIGKGNQASSGTTSGHNSPVVTAGRDLHLNMPHAPAEQDEEIFSDLEETMPDVLQALRSRLAEQPSVRYIVITATIASSPVCAYDRFLFSNEEYPKIQNYMRILENHRLIEAKRAGFSYLMTERFVKYLRCK